MWNVRSRLGYMECAWDSPKVCQLRLFDFESVNCQELLQSYMCVVPYYPVLFSCVWLFTCIYIYLAFICLSFCMHVSGPYVQSVFILYLCISPVICTYASLQCNWFRWLFLLECMGIILFMLRFSMFDDVWSNQDPVLKYIIYIT